MSRLWTTDGRTTECEDRARILETEFAKISLILPHLFIKLYCFAIYIYKLINEVFLHQSLQDVAKLLKLLEPAMYNLGWLAPNCKARKI